MLGKFTTGKQKQALLAPFARATSPTCVYGIESGSRHLSKPGISINTAMAVAPTRRPGPIDILFCKKFVLCVCVGQSPGRYFFFLFWPPYRTQFHLTAGQKCSYLPDMPGLSYIAH